MHVWFFHAVPNTVLTVADPFPAAGSFVLRMEPYVEYFLDVPPDVFLRIRPQLQDLSDWTIAKGYYPFYWTIARPNYVAPTRDADIRGSFLPSHPINGLYRITPGKISLAASSTTIKITGSDLLAGCETARCSVGSGAGTVKYEFLATGQNGNGGNVRHVKPGPSHALTVSYVSPDLVVTLATDGSGAITSTAADVAAAVNASAWSTIYYGMVGTAGTAQVGSGALIGGTGPQLVFALGGYTSLPATIKRATSGLDSGQVSEITFDVPQGALTFSGCVVDDIFPISIMLDYTLIRTFPFRVVA